MTDQQNDEVSDVTTAPAGAGSGGLHRPSEISGAGRPQVPGEQSLLGRDAEWARIAELVGSAVGTGRGSSVLVVTGEPGAGKTSLLDRAADRAAAGGALVLRARGSESEHGIGLAGLHQLLRPLLSGAGRLPESQRRAVRGAFGIGAGAGEPVDPLHLRVGVSTLVGDAAARRPLLLVVDDLQWLDLGSLDLLAFIARRLDGEAAALLAAAREETVPLRFDRDFPQVTAGPLDRASAGLLLDAQPVPPCGRARSRILQEAAGNPLALVELSRALAHGRVESGGGRALPLTKRLENLFAADLPDLPADTRRALLLAAATDTGELSDVVGAAGGLDCLGALEPAERAGLVRIQDGLLRLRHPLVRSAIYGAASFTERRSAHLALAGALVHEPDRRAWHLAAAATGPDAEVADALAASAERARSRGGHAAAAAALERAADLTPDPELRCQRLLAAARSAMFGGHPQWVGELTARVPGYTDRPDLRAQAGVFSGWALGLTLRHDAALETLLAVAEQHVAALPDAALSALGIAATSAFASGDPFHRAELRRLAERLADLPEPNSQAWIAAATAPHTGRARALELLAAAKAAMGEDDLSALTVLGGTAWCMDETALAVELLGRALDHLRRAGTAGTNATVSQAIALAQYESGAWTAARNSTEDTLWMAAEAGAELSAIGTRILQATLDARQGDPAARERAEAAVRGVDLRRSLALQVRHRVALSIAATAAGDHAEAYRQVRALFTRDIRPRPVHYHASLYYLGDLAAAAVHADEVADARAVFESVQPDLGDDRSPRLHAIVERAAALLAEGEDAERHFRAALADPAGAGWPFERALVQLDHAEWLRRRRRSAEARPLFGAALETFRRLDAGPWRDRAAAELRAAGAEVPAADAGAAQEPLTPQERRIAELAAQGLTNRDIAARLYLSPRTVGYHLRKVFAKLGIRARAQLRDALGGLA
ncbi:ATP-binding protein [Kitasatospora griseola]|uniref:ATP-binding protein n=1 Tax=Kitasatospora griseola TaxID=2064 RepID=UPI00343227CD